MIFQIACAIAAITLPTWVWNDFFGNTALQNDIQHDMIML
jgi:hypothetical protein